MDAIPVKPMRQRLLDHLVMVEHDYDVTTNLYDGEIGDEQRQSQNLRIITGIELGQ